MKMAQSEYLPFIILVRRILFILLDYITRRTLIFDIQKGKTRN